jgi:hypothetical protein
MLIGRTVRITYRVRDGVHSPSAVLVNGVAVEDAKREANPYRKGGLRVRESDLRAHLSAGENSITVEL